MARQGFSIEKLLEITPENGDVGVHFLFGSGAPVGTAGETDDAPLGSIYLRTDSYKLYKKDTDSSSASDWIDLGSFFDLIGVAEGDLDLGVFTGGIISDNTDIKTALQELESFIEKNIAEDDSANGVTAVTVIDDELVDEIRSVTYHVAITFADDESRVEDFHVKLSHNGTTIADATEVKETVYGKTKHGAAFNGDVSAGLSGAGATQKMELRVASTELNGVNVRSRKISQVSI